MIVVGLVVLAFVGSYFNKKTQTEIPKILKIGGVTLNIEVADTGSTREQGLSGRSSLAENEGLFFIFQTEGYYGFWMKDMNFPIDMIWINKDKKIVYIESNVSPETYPKVFEPTSPSLYVLETSAGFSAQNNVKIGDFVAF